MPPSRNEPDVEPTPPDAEPEAELESAPVPYSCTFPFNCEADTPALLASVARQHEAATTVLLKVTKTMRFGFGMVGAESSAAPEKPALKPLYHLKLHAAEMY